MPYKDLILIDNSSSVTTLNREIVKEVVEYIIKSSDENKLICVATTNGGIEYLNAYEDTKESKLRSLENLTYADNATSAEDALYELITSWSQNDFAERQILLISDGHEAEDTYTAEELYFVLKDSQYPVHILCLDQNGNESDLRYVKSLARISKASIFHTEFEGDDADYDKKIGEGILDALTEKEEEYEERSFDIKENNTESINNPGSSYSNNNIESNDLTSNKILVDNNILYGNKDDELSDSVIYEMSEMTGKKALSPALIIAALLILFSILVLAVLRNMKKKTEERKDEERFLNAVKSNTESGGKFSSGRFSEFTDDFNETRPLQSNVIENVEDEDSGTRLLFQTREGVDVTFEDRADPTKYYRTSIIDRIVLGRSQKLCDLAFDYDDSVSSKHCELFLRGNDVYVRDLSSANGTIVNQQKVYQEVKINTGDILKLGQLSLFVQILRRNSFG